MHVPTATGTDFSTTTGTAAQCAAACTLVSTCKGFVRSYALADTASGTCWLKNIASNGTNQWGTYNTFVKIPDQNQAIYGVNSNGVTWKHDGVSGYANGSNNGWLQITNVGQTIILFSFTQLQNGIYVGTTTDGQVVYKSNETGVWTRDTSWAMVAGARVTRRYWSSNSAMVLGTNGNVYRKDFNNMYNTWSLWWYAGTNVLSIMEHPDTPDRFVAVLNDNKVWEYNGNPVYMARNTWTNISPGSVRSAVYNMATQKENDNYDYYSIIAVGAGANDVMFKLSVASGGYNYMTGLSTPVGTWTQVTGSCCVARIG